MWTVYGILSVLRYIKTGDEFLLWLGIIIGLLHFILLIFWLFITSKSEIDLVEIKAANFKERFGKRFLDINLKSGSKRRIIKIEPVANELKAFFTEKKIVVK